MMTPDFSAESDTRKLAIVHHRFGPYHQARIEAAAVEMSAPVADSRPIKVIGVELSQVTDVYSWDPIRLRPPARQVTVCDTDSRSLSSSEIGDAIDTTLTEVDPDVIAVPGWSDNGAIATIRWAIRNHRKLILMSESNEFDFGRRPIQEAVKRHIVSCFQSALVGGTSAKKYLQILGMPEERIFDGYDTVDNDHFSSAGRGEVAKLKNELKLTDKDRCFLVVSRFVPKKNLNHLLSAFKLHCDRLISDGEAPWKLVLVGDGPLEADLRLATKQLGIEANVKFAGFRQYDQIPAFYSLCDAFVHVSFREQWGLVINEAMAASRPVIVSQSCGCAGDLVPSNDFGITIDPRDRAELVEAMVHISRTPSSAKQMASRGAEHISQWGLARYAKNMRSAFDLAANSDPRHGRMSQFLLKCLAWRMAK